MASKPTTSRFGRLARLGGMTSKVGAGYISQRLKGAFQDEDTRKDGLDRVHIDNAKEVARTMGSLKGAAMKFGQQIAQAVEGMDLPDEVGAVLRTLNDKAEPVPFATIKKDIEEELEAPISELFASLDEAPLGTASLAQAHGGTLPDGTPIVIKVLHRHIEASVDSDLRAMKSMFIGGRILNRDRDEIDIIFSEVRERLLEELDYFNEAGNIEYFRRQFVDMHGVRFPSTHPALCAKRVLTMDRLPGVPLSEFLPNSTEEARQNAGRSLGLIFFRMVYDLRALHADPHEGNYLFEPDGTVGLIDFGCVKRFDEFWIADYARLANAAIDGERDEVIRILKSMGGIVGDDPGADQLAWEFSDLLGRPFRDGPYRAGVAEDSVSQSIREIAPRFLKYPQIRTPKDMIYLHRSLGGIYAMLRRLEAEQDWRALGRPYNDRAIARAEGRI